MSNVAKLQTNAVPLEKEAPALGFSLQVDLGSGRVATLQTFLPNDCPQHALDGMLDKMTRAGDRQRAHYKLEELERDLKNESKLHAQHQEDLDRIDAEYDVAQAKRYADIAQMQSTVDAYMQAARDNHVSSGRRNAFEVKGRDKAHLSTLGAGIVKLKGEIDTATAERDVAHANFKTTHVRRGEIIAGIQAEIDRNRAIVWGGKAP